MKVILIGNYLPDKQESMIRFTHLLNKGFRSAGIESEIWTPPILFGSNVKVTNAGIGKWLAYIDKYVIFPLILKWRLKGKNIQKAATRFHICDHSNSPYLKYLPPESSSITCHDVIAIRGGLGFTDSHQPASRLGKLLQKWIKYYLERARVIAFVSELTLNQFKEILDGKVTGEKRWKVIHNSFNEDFRPMDLSLAKNILSRIGVDNSTPFLLHVGSDLPRKNRKLLLDMLNILSRGSTVNVCFAGESLNKDLLKYAELLGLSSKVFQVVKPDHQTLIALYSTCAAFVFPSLSEGFGWPVIEAQACGAPVIASNIEPMPEISDGAALHFDPTNAGDFAKGFLSLQDEVLRQELIQKGFANGQRFNKEKMIKSYIDLYNQN